MLIGMLFRTHIVFSLAVYFLLDYFLTMPFWVLFFILFATAFVDIDIKNSKFGNRWYFRPLQWLVKHRGILHSLVFALVLSLVIGMVFSQFCAPQIAECWGVWAGFGFFVGYISHLFLDCWTVSGVKLFWPFSFKIKGFVKSGGIFEEVIFVLLLLGDIFVIGKVVFGYLF